MTSNNYDQMLNKEYSEDIYSGQSEDGHRYAF